MGGWAGKKGCCQVMSALSSCCIKTKDAVCIWPSWDWMSVKVSESVLEERKTKKGYH